MIAGNVREAATEVKIASQWNGRNGEIGPEEATVVIDVADSLSAVSDVGSFGSEVAPVREGASRLC